MIISDVDDLKGAISIGNPNPISNGPITLVSPKLFIILYEIAALCCPGIINIFAFPTILEKGSKLWYSLFNATYDSNSLGTLSLTSGTVRLVGPTPAQIRGLFSAGNDLTGSTTGYCRYGSTTRSEYRRVR